MNLEKIKWKTRLRLEQMQKLAKLAKLELQHKRGLYKGEEFAYHLLREQYKSWLHIDPEQEYLEEHGLLPIEEEPEELAPEPEKEAEPGLVCELDFFELMMLTVGTGDYAYRPTLMKEYEDRIQLAITRTDDNCEDAEFSFELPKNGRLLPFEIEGQKLRWDCTDRALRFIPVYDEDKSVAVNEHLSILDEKVLAVNKEYAEAALSEVCRSYAFKADEKAYYWCIDDHSNCTVIFELNNELFGSIRDYGYRNYGKLQLYCRSFAEFNADTAEKLFYQNKDTD